VVDETLEDLEEAGCVELVQTSTPLLLGDDDDDEDDDEEFKKAAAASSAAASSGVGGGGQQRQMSHHFGIRPTTAGMVAAYYYIDYRSVGIIQHGLRSLEKGIGDKGGGQGAGGAASASSSSVDNKSQSKLMMASLQSESESKSSKIMMESKMMAAVCKVLSDTQEFAELPVRHNEEDLNGELAKLVPWPVDPYTLDSPHTKAFLLLQAHCCRAKLPISDFINDQKSVLDQALRVLNAMVDISADEGALQISVAIMKFAQRIVMATLPWSSSPSSPSSPSSSSSELMQLPNVTPKQAAAVEAALLSLLQSSCSNQPKNKKNDNKRGGKGGYGGGKCAVGAGKGVGGGKGTSSGGGGNAGGSGGSVVTAEVVSEDSNNNNGGPLQSLMQLGAEKAFQLLRSSEVKPV
jgi:hypothetical protein